MTVKTAKNLADKRKKTIYNATSVPQMSFKS